MCRKWCHRLFCQCAALALLLILGAISARSEPSDFDLGTIADHLIDPAGELSIDNISSTSTAVTFVVANGRPANYGPQPTARAALWLRIKIPDLSRTDTAQWIVSIQEVRIRRVDMFVPNASTWRVHTWNGMEHANPLSVETRYPALSISGADLSNKTIYLRIETGSSMRAMVRLQGDMEFAVSYGTQNLLFGVASGVLGVLALYLFANGLATSDRPTLLLATFATTYLLYILSHQAFLETHLAPGALLASRVISILTSNLLFAWWLLFSDAYLRVGDHRPLLSKVSRVVAGLCMLFAVASALAVFTDLRVFRRLLPFVGVGSLLLGAFLAVAMLAYERRRAIIFILCWSLGLAAGILRMAHDILPGLGTNVYALNATYFATCLCFVIFGIVTSIEIQHRERALRRAVEATTERLRDFARSASDSFWEADNAGRITFATGPTAAMSGLSPGALLSEIIHARSGESADAFRGSLASAKPVRGTLQFVADDGEHRYVELRGAPWLNSGGQFLGYRGVASDITQDTLDQRRQEQQQRLAAVGQLAGGVAHEINNLLHPIINLARRTADRLEKTDERHHWLTVVVDSGKRAAEIVSALLSSVRPIQERASDAPLKEGVSRALESVRSVVPQGISLSLTGDGSVGPALPVHEVFQVVANLTANAVHATKGGGRIVLDIRNPGDDGSADRRGVHLSVTDEGEGMSEETLRRALDPFFTTKRADSGTGLGLYVVHQVVRRWGASLDIQSTLGRGTKVTIRFLSS